LLKEYVAYLRGRKQHPEREEAGVCAAVSRWRSSLLRGPVEAYLLTDAEFELIAKDLSVEEAAVRRYEALFFNVRDDTGRHVMPGPRLRLTMAGNQEDEEDAPESRMLRSAALSGGLPLLRELTGTGNEPGADGDNEVLQTLVTTELKRRLLAGDLSAPDLTRLANTIVTRDRMLHETGQTKNDADQVVDLTLGLLKLSAPQVLQRQLSEAESKEETAKIQERLRMQRTTMCDKAEQLRSTEGQAALNELIKQAAMPLQDAGTPS